MNTTSITKIKNSIRHLAIAAGLLSAFECNAQDTLNDFPSNEVIRISTMEFPETSQLIPKGWFQLETGLQNEFKTGEQNVWKRNNAITLKYSATDLFELRLTSSYGNDRIKHKTSDNTVPALTEFSGLGPVSLGTKISLRPNEISILANFDLPYWGSENYKPTYVSPQILFLFTKKLNPKATFTSNIGVQSKDENVVLTTLYSTSLSYDLRRDLSVSMEFYGFLKKNKTPDHRFDVGLSYILKNNIGFNFTGGAGLTQNSPDYFISAGLSARIQAFNKKQ